MAVAVDVKYPFRGYVVVVVHNAQREGWECPNVEGNFACQLPDGLKEFVLAKPSKVSRPRPPAPARAVREGTDREWEGAGGRVFAWGLTYITSHWKGG